MPLSVRRLANWLRSAAVDRELADMQRLWRCVPDSWAERTPAAPYTEFFH